MPQEESFPSPLKYIDVIRSIHTDLDVAEEKRIVDSFSKRIHVVRVETDTVVRYADIRDQNPSFGMICPGEPHQRSPIASKFEYRSQEETEWQEGCAREAA